MPIQEYTIDENDILHHTKIDLVNRGISPTIHAVQYDKTLPIVEVSLFNNGNEYEIPDDSDVYLRFPLKDGTSIYKKVLGCSEDRTKVYFSIDNIMTKFYGEITAILEIIIYEQFVDTDRTYDNRTAGTSPINFVIDQNPVPYEYEDLYQGIQLNNSNQNSYSYIVLSDIHMYEHNVSVEFSDGMFVFSFNDTSSNEVNPNNLINKLEQILSSSEDKIKATGYVGDVNIFALSYDSAIKIWSTKTTSHVVTNISVVKDNVRRIF